MAGRELDPARHSYTGGHFRQRLRNIVGGYVEGKIAGEGSVASTARMVEDRFAEEEKLNKVDAKDVGVMVGEEKVVLYPTYARIKPHLLHVLHQHAPTSEHGTQTPQMFVFAVY
jgi:hypothetical protein